LSYQHRLLICVATVAVKQKSLSVWKGLIDDLYSVCQPSGKPFLKGVHTATGKDGRWNMEDGKWRKHNFYLIIRII
jgi:hypothetical protein